MTPQPTIALPEPPNQNGLMSLILADFKLPERQISHVIHLLTEGSPAEQKDALDAYFLPDASFIHPLCRVPSFSHISLPLIGEINSRWVIWMIYRWYKILSPRIVLNVECDGTSSPPFTK
jgi:hypothetical protein